MKRILALALVGLLALAATARAQSLDDQYVQVFNLIQEADSLADAQPSQALPKYVQAQTVLERIQKGSPDWNPKVVSFRLSYIASRVAAISNKAPTVATSATGVTNASGQTIPAPALSPEQREAQMNTLKEQVHQLQADKIVLETKLKEALALQPAEADPRQLARAEEKVKALQRENDLLKASLESQKSEAKPAIDTKALDEAQKNVANLQAENQMLKKQLADLQTAAAAKTSNTAATQLAQVQAQVAVLQSDKESLRLQNASLEKKLKDLMAAKPAPAAAPVTAAADAQRIKQLERERDDLRKQVDRLQVANTKAARKNKSGKASSSTPDLENELAAARTRLEVLEAQAVPYSPEELVLLKQPATKLTEAETKTSKASTKEMPAGSSKLVAEAQRYFAAKQYSQAEAAYAQILKQDQKSVPALANLAAIQSEAHEFTDAERNVQQALALDPEDSYSLYILGILRFRQAKYDDALEALSRAAKLEPKNAEVQNYLGLALSEKGQRGPAETALRKALVLQPGYAGAHYNLAIIYLSQKPPAVELARWHYQKAIEAGFPHNADIEKQFEGK